MLQVFGRNLIEPHELAVDLEGGEQAWSEDGVRDCDEQKTITAFRMQQCCHDRHDQLVAKHNGNHG